MSNTLNNINQVSPVEAGLLAINRETTYPRILVLFTILYTFLVIYGAGMGVRGTDQYWYIADIQTLLEGKPAVSNNLYPPSVLNDNASADQPFVHNTPYVYIASIPARLFGSFWGAIILNSIAYLISAFLIFLTLCRLKINDRIAASTAGIFLLFPMNYWLSVNAMSESLLVLGVTFLTWLLVKNEKISTTSWVLSFATLVFLIFTRESLIVLGLLSPLFYLLYKREFSTRTIATASFLFFLVVITYLFRGSLLPHNVNCSFPEMIRRMTPGVTDNMFCYFNTEEVKIDWSLWWSKIAANIHNQFNITGSSAYGSVISLSFYLPTNILVGIGLYFSLVKSDDKLVRRAGLVLLGLVASHTATLILIENLPRYLVILPPIAFILTTVSVKNTLLQRNNRTKGMFFLTLLFAFTAANLLAAKSVREKASVELSQTMQIQKLVKQIPGNHLLGYVETDIGDNMCLLSYALKSEKILFSRSTYSQSLKNTLTTATKPGFMILKGDLSPNQEEMGLVLEYVADMPQPFPKHKLYKVNASVSK